MKRGKKRKRKKEEEGEEEEKKKKKRTKQKTSSPVGPFERQVRNTHNTQQTHTGKHTWKRIERSVFDGLVWGSCESGGWH